MEKKEQAKKSMQTLDCFFFWLVFLHYVLLVGLVVFLSCLSLSFLYFLILYAISTIYLHIFGILYLMFVVPWLFILVSEQAIDQHIHHHHRQRRVINRHYHHRDHGRLLSLLIILLWCFWYCFCFVCCLLILFFFSTIYLKHVYIYENTLVLVSLSLLHVGCVCFARFIETITITLYIY